MLGRFEKTLYLDMVLKSHIGFLHSGILRVWNRAMILAHITEMAGSRNSFVIRCRDCNVKWYHG